MNSLKIFTLCAIAALVASVLLLPLPPGSKTFVLVVLAFAAVFVLVEAGRKGKLFAAITIALLTLYLVVTVQRGVLLLDTASPVSIVLGICLIVLPILGAWAMVREIIFGARIEKLARQLADTGELPEDNLPRTPSGRIEREAADREFQRFQEAVEADPASWKNWFNLSCIYDASGDRKRARKAMRIAIAIHRGKIPAQLTI